MPKEERRRDFATFLADEGLTCRLTDRKARVGPEPGTVAIGGRYAFRMGPEETVRARRRARASMEARHRPVDRDGRSHQLRRSNQETKLVQVKER